MQSLLLIALVVGALGLVPRRDGYVLRAVDRQQSVSQHYMVLGDDIYHQKPTGWPLGNDREEMEEAANLIRRSISKSLIHV